MIPGQDVMFVVDPLDAAIAMQQGMTGGVNSPERLLFLAGVVVGAMVLMLVVAGLCELAARRTPSDEASSMPASQSVFSDPQVWAMTTASITGFWLPPSAFERPNRTDEEPPNRVAA
jgi:hypothetical protein